jgi:hypothetical protein
MRALVNPRSSKVSFLPEAFFISQAKIVSWFSPIPPTHYSSGNISFPHLEKGWGIWYKNYMSKTYRILIAVGIIVLDLVVFFLPLAAIFLAYIVVYNPPWAKDFLERLD